VEKRKGWDISNKALIWLAVVLIPASIGIVCWRAFHYSFISDDWAMLQRVVFQSPKVYTMNALHPGLAGHAIYRPLGMGYFWLMYHLFGLNALGFHACAFVIHAINSMMVAFLANGILRHRLLALTAGLLYASSFRIHFEPLLWMVGIFDLGGMFCFLSALLFYIRGKILPSVLVFLAGLFIKEHLIVLPAVIGLYSHFERRQSLKDAAKQIMPYAAAVLFVYLPAKMLGLHGVHVRADNPYALSIGKHVLQNLETLIGLGLIGLCPSLWLKISMSLTCIVGIIQSIRYKQRLNLRSTTTMLVLWAIIAASPVCLLKNHVMEGYYFTYSYPALIMLALVVATRFRVHKSAMLVVVSTLVIANIAGSTAMFAEQDGLGVTAASVDDYLIPRAHFQQMLTGYIDSHRARVKQNVRVIVVSNNDRFLYCSLDEQLQTLTHDATVSGVVVPAMQHDTNGYSVMSPTPEDPRRLACERLDKDQTLHLQIIGDAIQERPL